MRLAAAKAKSPSNRFVMPPCLKFGLGVLPQPVHVTVHVLVSAHLGSGGVADCHVVLKADCECFIATHAAADLPSAAGRSPSLLRIPSVSEKPLGERLNGLRKVALPLSPLTHFSKPGRQVRDSAAVLPLVAVLTALSLT